MSVNALVIYLYGIVGDTFEMIIHYAWFFNLRTSIINVFINYIKFFKVDKKRLLLEIHETNLMFKGFVIRLNNLMKSIRGIRSIVFLQ